ncbi:ABC transporter ATP-binding protein [Brevibacterium album]|uniref:ABC transporter ATP-binding protein n=1 Tax=Brevibacterium album TaxID=417948 RepID=UPI0003FF06E9|nr:ABC transporter ATP-binding protein [Brevibacterium album]
MIGRLAEYLGADRTHLLRSYLRWTVIASILQGLALGASVPLLRALLADDLSGAVRWLCVLAVAAIACWVVEYRGVRRGFDVAIELLTGLRLRLGDHIAALPLGWFAPANTGRLGHALSLGVMDMLALPAHQLTPLIRAVVTPGTLLVVLIVVDWRLGAIAAACLAPMALVHWFSGRVGRRADEAVGEALAETSDRIVEFAHTQQVLRTQDRAGAGRTLIDRALHDQHQRERRQLWWTVPPLLAGNVVMQLALLSLVAGLLALAAGTADPLALVTLLAALPVANRFIAPLGDIAGQAVAIRVSQAEMDTIDRLLTAEPLDEPAQPRIPDGTELTVEDVSFSYAQDRTVLRDISLTVPEGSLTAIVGPSGSGKSTLIRLLARFHDPVCGTVRMGGIALPDMGSAALHSRIAPVFQDSYLFSGTVEDNVRLAHRGASQAELDRAAGLARLSEVLAELPEGWSTEVGEGGARLSGGQRQRVALARALLKDAPVLLLDEATGALDAENQRAVSEMIAGLRGERTVVVIAHQLTTITAADQILFVEDGAIAERGTHRELLAAGGRYAAHWEMLTAATTWRLTAPEADPGTGPGDV